jgi:hypothetical protein
MNALSRLSPPVSATLEHNNVTGRHFRQTGTLTLLALLLTGAMIACAATSLGSELPQWRGPTRDGQFTGPKWPERLDTYPLQRTWRFELGPICSGPIASGDGVFTTEGQEVQGRHRHRPQDREGTLACAVARSHDRAVLSQAERRLDSRHACL